VSPSSSSNQLVNLARTYLDDVEDRKNRARFLAILSREDALEVTNAVERAVDAIAADDEVDHQRLAAYAARRITAHQSAAAVLESLRVPAAADPSHLTEVERLLHEPLPLRLLSDHVFAHPELEQLITCLRAGWLEATGSPASWQSPPRALLAAVALQMHTTEWAHSETAAEGAGSVSSAIDSGRRASSTCHGLCCSCTPCTARWLRWEWTRH